MGQHGVKEDRGGSEGLCSDPETSFTSQSDDVGSWGTIIPVPGSACGTAIGNLPHLERKSQGRMSTILQGGCTWPCRSEDLQTLLSFRRPGQSSASQRGMQNPRLDVGCRDQSGTSPQKAHLTLLVPILPYWCPQQCSEPPLHSPGCCFPPTQTGQAALNTAYFLSQAIE